MTRIFLDTSVLYAAILSASGASRLLLLAGLRGRIGIALSGIVLVETERNIRKKPPHMVGPFQALRDALADHVIDPPAELVNRAARFVATKDAPIVAGAAHAQAQYLVTFDRQHLLSRAREISQEFGADVALPSDLLHLIQDDTPAGD